MTPRQILNLPMTKNDSGADTVRGYLLALLGAVWREKEGFSGKRPFGNSAWECDLYQALIKADVIPGTVDEDGYLDTIAYEDEQKADELILAAIAALGTGEEAAAS